MILRRCLRRSPARTSSSTLPAGCLRHAPSGSFGDQHPVVLQSVGRRASGAGRPIILVSFPHVEGPTSVEQPATGRLDRQPISVHARTRLEEERLLFERTAGRARRPWLLRLGLIYGRGILMIEAARWLARRRLLCVWRDPTVFQLLSTADFLRAAEAAISSRGFMGSITLGTNNRSRFRSSWTKLCRVWGYPRPVGSRSRLIYAAAWSASVRRGSRGPRLR